MGNKAKISLVIGLVVLVLVIGLAIGGVGNGEFHAGTVVDKGIWDSPIEKEKAYFLVDEGNKDYTVRQIKSWTEYYTTDIGDNISWEDRGAINAALLVPGVIATFVIFISALLYSDEWW